METVLPIRSMRAIRTRCRSRLADPTLTPYVSPKTAGDAATAQQALNSAALQKLLGFGVLGVGAGMSARALMGLRNLLSKPRAIAATSSIPTSVPISVPMGPEADEDEKYASTTPLQDAAALLKEANLFDARPGVNWWMVPGSVGAAGGGIYGGWSLIDKLMAGRHKAEMESELEDAEQEYQDAIRQQYQRAMQGKQGDFDGLDDVFDRFTSGMEKDAGLKEWAGQGKQTAGDIIHGGIGAYLTALALVGGAGGLTGYNWAKSQGKHKLTEQALQIRNRLRQQPQPVYAYPRPVRIPPSPEREEEEEMVR